MLRDPTMDAFELSRGAPPLALALALALALTLAPAAACVPLAASPLPPWRAFSLCCAAGSPARRLGAPARTARAWCCWTARAWTRAWWTMLHGRCAGAARSLCAVAARYMAAQVSALSRVKMALDVGTWRGSVKGQHERQHERGAVAPAQLLPPAPSPPGAVSLAPFFPPGHPCPPACPPSSWARPLRAATWRACCASCSMAPSPFSLRAACAWARRRWWRRWPRPAATGSCASTSHPLMRHQLYWHALRVAVARGYTL